MHVTAARDERVTAWSEGDMGFNHEGEIAKQIHVRSMAEEYLFPSRRDTVTVHEYKQPKKVVTRQTEYKGCAAFRYSGMCSKPTSRT